MILVAQESDAVHECSSRVVGAFPHVALGTGDEMRLLVQAAFEPIPIVMIQEVGVDVVPLLFKQLPVRCFVGKDTVENMQGIESLSL